MSELYFMGIDIIEEAKALMNLNAIICTDGMTEEELRAYNLGVENMMSVLNSIVNDDELPVLNINGLEAPTELSIEDLEDYYLI